MHNLRISFAIPAACLLLSSCSSGGSDADSARADSADSALAVQNRVQEEFLAQNDIGMTVRSVANTINIGDRLDSTAYNFEGVLTDGSGMPLFTDFSGMPGKWEVEVIDSTEVRIRNLETGDLQPNQLIDYLTANLQGQHDDLELETETDAGDSHIVNYRYGRTSLQVVTRPLPIGDTGEVAPGMEIILKADTLPPDRQ